MIAAHAQAKPKAPVMLHFGEHDHGIPMADVQKVMAAQPEIKVFSYDAGHGFSCDERANFDKASQEKALGRTLAFLAEQLGA